MFASGLSHSKPIDPVAIMLSNDVNKVIETAEKCFADAGQDGGYIMGPGCASPINTPGTSRPLWKCPRSTPTETLKGL